MKALLLLLSFVSYIASAKYFGIKDCRIFVDFIFYDLSEFSRYHNYQLTYPYSNNFNVSNPDKPFLG